MFSATLSLRAASILLCGGIALMLAGCAEERESLHDEDHFVPEHWPTSLADAADKMAERLAQIEGKSGSAEAADELGDLVSWAPEVAGDTDLSEEDWLSIYEISEKLSVVFERGGTDLEKHKEELNRLQDLLRSADAKLAADQQPSTQPSGSTEAGE